MTPMLLSFYGDDNDAEIVLTVAGYDGTDAALKSALRRCGGDIVLLGAFASQDESLFLGGLFSAIAQAFNPAAAIAKPIVQKIAATTADPKQAAAATALSKDIATGQKIAATALVVAATAATAGAFAAPASVLGVLGVASKLAKPPSAALPAPSVSVPSVIATTQSPSIATWWKSFLKTYFGL